MARTYKVVVHLAVPFNSASDVRAEFNTSPPPYAATVIPYTITTTSTSETPWYPPTPPPTPSIPPTAARYPEDWHPPSPFALFSRNPHIFVHVDKTVSPARPGMVKHVILWLKQVLNARFACLSLNHNLHHFSTGITHLSRVLGKEHKDIMHVLLGYPSQTAATYAPSTLQYFENALDEFHANKDIFEQLGVHHNFNLPKLHALLHYVASIKDFGTTDNYSSEYTECLQIDFAKDAYRATNHKDEYPQMTLWLLWWEKMQWHALYIQWQINGKPVIGTLELPRIPCRMCIKIA
ncbi:hypothetical protein BV25DRAFT_1920826 [Artomyces pyxidatus]|uniref:Uncharacterized protein n=1 Tax=Artomyces pyxidatus TaxID=48021 RepID=A0ACB8SKB1_9AGAM|nr:hypothetical protein BV25DRAFT_1920826 [Artomyces pyxidatus]